MNVNLRGGAFTLLLPKFRLQSKTLRAKGINGIGNIIGMALSVAAPGAISLGDLEHMEKRS